MQEAAGGHGSTSLFQYQSSFISIVFIFRQKSQNSKNVGYYLKEFLELYTKSNPEDATEGREKMMIFFFFFNPEKTETSLKRQKLAGFQVSSEMRS